MRRLAIVAAIALWPTAPSHAQTLQALGAIQAGARVLFSAVSPTGRQVAGACRDHKLRIWELPGGRLLQTVDMGAESLSAMSYSHDGKHLALADAAGGVQVLDSVTGVVTQRWTAGPMEIVSIVLSPDASRVAVAPSDSPVHLWAVNERKLLAEMQVPFGGSSALAFSPDGRLLASADSDTIIRIYDSGTGQLRSRYENLLLESFTLDFSPDSKTLIVGGADKLVVAIDPQSGKELRRLAKQPDPVAALAVLADGKTVILICLNADHMTEAKNTVAWNLETGQSKVLASGKTFNGGAASADGRLILTSSEDNVLKLWAIQ